MAVGTLWYAQMARAHIANAVTSIVTNTPIFAQISTATGTASGQNAVEWTGRVTNLTISGGSRDLAAVNTLGISQLQHNQRPEIVTATFSLIYDNVNAAALIAGTVAVTAFSYTGTLANTGTYNRYQFGEKSTAATDRVLLACVFTLDDGVGGATGKTVYISINNAVMVSPPEVSLSADGYVEEKWTLKCLAQNYYVEANFTAL